MINFQKISGKVRNPEISQLTALMMTWICSWMITAKLLVDIVAIVMPTGTMQQTAGF